MPTLSLAMIVRDEEEVLERCLKSCHLLFDEMVIIDTGSKDRTVEIAKSFPNAKVGHFDWIKDFSAARNYSFEQATGQFIMWLDADDVIREQDLQNLLQLKKVGLRDVDAVLLPYEYAHDEFDNSILTLYRHRIVRRSLKSKWIDPIHEFLEVPPGVRLLRYEASVHHYRTAQGVAQDGARNLKMLEDLVSQGGPNNGRNLFYLAKEHYYNGNHKKCIEVMEQYLKPDVDDWVENRKAGWGLLPECYRVLGKPDQALDAAERGLKESKDWADCYIEKALAYEALGNSDQAAIWLEKACLIPKPDTLAPLMNDKYTWLPHQQLVFLYDRTGKYHLAFLHCLEVFRTRGKDPNTRYNLEYLANQMLNTKKLRLGWWDQSPEDWGPARLRQHLIRWGLKERGVDAQLVDQSNYSECDVIIRRWSGPDDVGLIKELKRQDKLVILDLCEDLFDFKDIRSSLSEALKLADLVTCCSTALKKKAKEFNPNTVVIADAFDLPGEYNVEYEDHEPLKVVFCGYGGSYQNLQPYEKTIHKAAYHILAIHEHGSKYGDISVKWDLNTFAKHMAEGDVAVVAADYKRQPCKSANRVTQAMAVGLPVVASPLEAYKEVIRHGENGFIFNNDQELGEILEKLKSKELRKAIALKAQEDMTLFHPHTVGLEWYARAVQLGEANTKAQEKLNLGILSIEGWNNLLPGKGEGFIPADQLKLGANRYSHIHFSYVLEHYPQDEVAGLISELSRALAVNGKITMIFTDAKLAMDDYSANKLNWEELSRRFFQKGHHRSIVSVSYLKDLLVKAGFEEVHEMDLAKFPFTIVPNTNDPRPEPMQSGLICWRKKFAMESDPDINYVIPDSAVVKVAEKSTTASKEFQSSVDLVIPVYNNLEYTKLCLDSILKVTSGVPYRVTVVDSGSTDSKIREYYKELRKRPEVTVHELKKATFSQAVNYGIQKGKANFVCIMNNDLIVSEGWLNRLVETANADGVASVNPWSNCDLGWKHKDILEIKGVRLIPDMNINEVKDIIPDLQKAQYHQDPNPVQVDKGSFNAFYCTLIPRKLFNQIGYLDEDFKNGGEDADWCYRATLMGYKHLMRRDAFVFHFGAKTRKNKEMEDYEKYHKEDELNNLVLRKKWERPRVTFFTGAAWEKWTPDNVNKGGIGGSETACALMALELRKLGYEVFVFNDCQDAAGDYDGVRYLHWEEYGRWAKGNHSDILVVSRMVEPFDTALAYRAGFCWVHDIWVHPERIDLRLDKVKKFLCLSPWHKEFFAQHHGCPLDQIEVTTNGLDPTRFKDLDWEAKDPYRFVYSSSPDRGLDCLLEMWPQILEKYPKANLHVFYGFFNWLSAIKERNNKTQLAWAHNIMDRLKQPGVTNHDRVGQIELAKYYKSASVWLQPEPFTETNCITAKEAMAAGVMPICSDVAALATTVGPKRGIIIPFGDYNNAYQVYRNDETKEQFLKATFDVLDHPEKYKDRIRKNREEMLKDFTWEAVAKQWHRDYFSQHLRGRKDLILP